MTVIWNSVTDLSFPLWHFTTIYLSSFALCLFLFPPCLLVLPWLFSPTTAYCFLLLWLQSLLQLLGRQLLEFFHCCCCLHGYLIPDLGLCVFCTCFAASLSAASAAYPVNCLALPFLLHLPSGSSITSTAQDVLC